MDRNFLAKQNILVTSISKKIPLLKSVCNAQNKMNSNSQLVGSDSNNCIGKYFVDQFWQMPALDNIHIRDIIDYCNSNHIKVIIPTRDAELPFFAFHNEQLKNSGIHVMISGIEAINICQDKWLFSQNLHENNYPVIPSWLNLNEIPYENLVVKDRYGTGSRKIAINVDRDEAEKVAQQMENPIFQPFIEGEEYSVDLYLDKNHKAKGCIVRKREYVENGESQITTSIKYEEIERLISSLAEDMKLYGHVMFQVIINHNEEFHIIECNPRFGGASTLSIEMGLDSFYWFLLESNGVDLDTVPFVRSEKEKTLIRYPEDLMI